MLALTCAALYGVSVAYQAGFFGVSIEASLAHLHIGFMFAVAVLEGDHAGRAGRVVSLQALAPEPVYVVALADGDDVGVVQSGLRAALPDEG
jgi:hypothetical protein